MVSPAAGLLPEAITAFLEGTCFEDVIRTAVSLGGDCDTLTCIAGSMAEAFYGVPEELKEECRKRITPEMLSWVNDQVIGRKAAEEEEKNQTDNHPDLWPSVFSAVLLVCFYVASKSSYLKLL